MPFAMSTSSSRVVKSQAIPLVPDSLPFLITQYIVTKAAMATHYTLVAFLTWYQKLWLSYSPRPSSPSYPALSLFSHCLPISLSSPLPLLSAFPFPSLPPLDLPPSIPSPSLPLYPPLPIHQFSLTLSQTLRHSYIMNCSSHPFSRGITVDLALSYPQKPCVCVPVAARFKRSSRAHTE